MDILGKLLRPKGRPAGAPEAPAAPAPPVKRPFQRSLAPRKGVVCPFCMEHFQVWELEFRSDAEDESGIKGYPRAIDEKYVAFWDNVNLPAQNQEQNFVLRTDDLENVTEVLLWEGDWIPNTAENRAAIEKKAVWKVRDKFGTPSKHRICPFCHNPLPDVIGHAPSYIISMMGNTSSGKTVYLSRLLLSALNGALLPGWELTADVIHTDPHAPKKQPEIKAALEKMFCAESWNDPDGDGEDRSDPNEGGQNGNRPGRESGKLADATPVKYIYPTILQLRKGRECRLVTLFDFPGEAIWKLNGDEDPFFQKLMHRINENTDGWLFILDGTMLPPVRRCAIANGDREYLSQGDLSDPSSTADPGSVLREFFNFFGAGNQIKAPVALTLSKADMIARYAGQLNEAGYQVAPDSLFLRDTPHANRSRVDLDDLWGCDQALRRFLEGDQVLTTARNLFRQYAWFAVSATGVPVKGGKMGREMAPPRRVMEPLEWLLWMLGAYAGDYTGKNPPWGGPIPQEAREE